MAVAYELIGIARRYLPLLRSALGMDVAWVSERDGRDQVLVAVDGHSEMFGLRAGDVISWDGAYCSRVVGDDLPTIIPDARHDPRTSALAATERFGIGAYASAPILTQGGDLFGMLCGISRGPRRELSETDGRFVAALATALGEELTIFSARAQTRRERREQIERVIGGSGLRMVAQPIVELSTMRVVGVEALARFDEPPQRPDQWFSDASALGMGTPLELAAIRGGLAFLTELPADVYVSVNASPATVQDGGLLDVLRTVEPRRVVLEITEHSSVDNYETLLGHLQAILHTGVRLAVDDAGAGYASFRHILNLRPDLIKLDRDMVSDVGADPARGALVRALVDFAASLGATVVAEGIETAEELACVTALGVGLGQGYFIARPGPLPLPPILPYRT